MARDPKKSSHSSKSARGFTISEPLATLCALSVIGGIVLLYQKDKPAEKVFSARGYSNVIKEHLLPYLSYNRNPEQRSLVVSLTEAGSNNPTIWKFYQQSYLEKDIEANDLKLWRIDRRGQDVAGIDPNVHNIPLPLNAPSYWEGALSVRTELSQEFILQGAQIESQQIITLQPIPPNIETMPTEIRVDPLGNNWDNQKSANTVKITDPSGIDIVKLFTLGDEIILEGLNANRAAIKVAAEPVGRSDYFIVPEEKQILLSFNTGQSALFTNRGVRGTRSQKLTSFQSLVGRDFNNRLESIAERFTGNMNQLIRNYETSEQASPQKISDLMRLSSLISLDPELQEKIEARIDLRIKSGTRSTPDYNALIPAAVTVMDALNGEILTLASAPSQDRVNAVDPNARASLKENQNFINHPIGSVAKPLIGAALLETWPSLNDLKIRRDLSEESQEVANGNKRVNQVAGYSFTAGIKPNSSSSSPYWVDYGEFIKRSYNSYAALLMVLGLSKNPQSEDKTAETIAQDYIISSQTPPQETPPRRIYPPLHSFSETGEIEGKLSAEALWSKEIKDLFGVRTETLRGEFEPTVRTDLLYRRTENLWKALFDEIDAIDTEILAPTDNGDAATAPTAFRNLSPERINLDLNKPNANVRGDIITLILGGGQSRWNTIRVAESYAYLVTGRKIRGQLSLPMDYDPDIGTSKTPKTLSQNCGPLSQRERQNGRDNDGKFCDLTRKTSMRGLYKVANEFGGTAHNVTLIRAIDKVNNAIGPNHHFCLFSKTGTPQIVHANRRKIDALITELGQSNAAYLRSVSGQDDNGNMRPYLNLSSGSAQSQQTLVRYDDDDFKVNALRLLRSDEPLRRRLDVNGVSASALVAHIIAYNDPKNRRLTSILSIDSDGKPVGRPFSIETDNPKFGRAYAYVAAIYEKKTSRMTNNAFCETQAYLADPVKAYSVAINVPYALPNEASQVAKQIGADTIEALIPRYLQPEDDKTPNAQGGSR